MNIELLKEKINDSNIQIYKINYSDIIFEDRVKLNCFYCSKYNTNWMCPPRIPQLDYCKIIGEYSNVAIVSISMDINNNFNDTRTETTVKLHKTLLMLEKELWNNNYPTAVSFIGGSCKLCKNGCAEDKCKQPGLSRIPTEATGINVIKSLKNIGIEIVFPPKDKLSRFGILLW